MGMLFVKYKMSFADAADLYGKYIAGWGEKSKTYRFDGIIDEEVVTKVIKSSSDVFELKITADKTELYEDETYDVTRISLAFVDQHGSTLSYANHIATCNIKGPLELIGPSTFPLIAGSRAFWVKTTGSSGVAQIEVALDNGLKANLDLIVN
jgi:beta-galactosidase